MRLAARALAALPVLVALLVATLAAGAAGGLTRMQGAAADTPDPSLSRSQEPGPARGPTKIVRTLDPPERRRGQLPYLLYLPAGHDDPTRTWPLLVMLHGSRGSGIHPGKLANYPIPRLIESGRHEVPFVVLAPQAPSGKSWPEVEAWLELVDEIAETHRIDPARVYLTGQSLGAEGVWHATWAHPGRFAAIAPMYGAADPAWAARIAATPVWVFHGARDTIVPVASSDRMVAELREHGAEVRYSRAEDRYHQPPTDDELLELFDWLLEHSLADAD